MAVAILRDEGVAEEAVHDAFVRALRHRRSYDGRGPLEGWVWRIVVNEARRRVRAEGELPLADAEPPSGDRFDDHDLVRESIAALPERQRLALFLRYYADLDYDAIATALDVKPGTVGATLHAAHAALRRVLVEVER